MTDSPSKLLHYENISSSSKGINHICNTSKYNHRHRQKNNHILGGVSTTVTVFVFGGELLTTSVVPTTFFGIL
jgi:hypothetical protein